MSAAASVVAIANCREKGAVPPELMACIEGLERHQKEMDALMPTLMALHQREHASVLERESKLQELAPELALSPRTMDRLQATAAKAEAKFSEYVAGEGERNELIARLSRASGAC